MEFLQELRVRAREYAALGYDELIPEVLKLIRQEEVKQKAENQRKPQES